MSRRLHQHEVAALAQAAMTAFRNGDMPAARSAFERIAQDGQADDTVWVGLAHACQRQGDRAAALAAIGAGIDANPANPQLLATKADLLHAAGERSAAQFYRAALKSAQAMPADPSITALLAHLHAMLGHYEGLFESHLRQRVAQAGIGQGAASRGFEQSLDLVLGKRQLYLQQPRLYYFPGLPQIEFFDRADFPWLARLEQSTAAIAAEAAALLKDGNAFQPYLKADPARPQLNRGGLFNNRDWGAFYLWEDGQLAADNAARCPHTMAALEQLPLPRIKGRSPNVLFSLMRPGAHIPPHTGILNTRLIGHLPLLVPPGCELRVGNEVREWRTGEAWLFDDTIEHEAWNRSDQTRVILLFEIWRPELSDAERALVGAMLEGIDEYRGARADWDM